MGARYAQLDGLRAICGEPVESDGVSLMLYVALGFETLLRLVRMLLP